MKIINEAQLIFDSRSANEGFARVAVSSFFSQLDPTVEEITDLKTAVSEAVTNAIVHGYREYDGKVRVLLRILENLPPRTSASRTTAAASTTLNRRWNRSTPPPPRKNARAWALP